MTLKVFDYKNIYNILTSSLNQTFGSISSAKKYFVSLYDAQINCYISAIHNVNDKIDIIIKSLNTCLKILT